MFFGAGLMLGSFIADRFGPFGWRTYWLALALFIVRYAFVLWKRLGLSRMAVGMVLAAGMFASFGLLGGSQREANDAIAGHWAWLVGLFVVIVGLMWWESRSSPERFGLFRRSSQTARFRDLITLRHIPDARNARPFSSS